MFYNARVKLAVECLHLFQQAPIRYVLGLWHRREVMCWPLSLLVMSMANFLYNTNHVYIGVIYIIIGLIGGSFGFGLSIIIRLELALPGYNSISALNYNSVITMHGLLMIFFMIMPILIGGFGNVLIPILLGCNDMIFPRLNLLSLWLSFFSLFLIILSLLIDSGVNAG
jgi:heme/copper-type cytochrome/quinol oxidase subunit 1